MKNTIKLLLIVFALSAVTFTSCKKEDFKNIIEKIKEGDKGDKDKGDKDKGRGGRNNDKDSTRRR